MPYANRDDQKDAQRRHYEKNRKDYFARAKRWDAKTRESVTAHLLAFLLNNPCVDCGEKDPVVLEFDHRDGTKKSFSLGEASSGNFALSTVISELEKCDVRCANCHRRKTYRERGMSHRDQI